jgi:hypothetical protein
MPDVLVVPALQLGDPVPLAVLVKARDTTLHRDPRGVPPLLFCAEFPPRPTLSPTDVRFSTSFTAAHPG